MKYSKSNSQILIENTKYIYIAKIITQGLGFFAQVLVIKKFCVELFGTYNFLLNSLIVFELISIYPLADVFNRFLPEYINNNDYKGLKRFILICFVVASLFLIVLLATIFIYADIFEKYFKISNFNEIFMVYILFVFTKYFDGFFSNVTTSLLLHKSLGHVRVLTSLISNIMIIFLIHDLTIVKMLLIQSFISFISIIFLSYILIDLIKMNKNEKPTGVIENQKKRIIRFGLFSSINQLGSGIIGKTSDYFIISAIGNQYWVGLYSFSYRIYSIIFHLLPMKEFFSILRPLFFRKFANNQAKKIINDYYNFIVKFLFPFYLFPVLYFIVFGKQLIGLIFDPKYLNTYGVTCIVLSSLLINAIFYPLGLVVQLFEKVEYGFYSKIVVIFSIFAGIFAMKYWGISAVALITVIGELSRNILMYLLLMKIVVIRYDIFAIVKYLSCSIILGVLFSGVRQYINNIYVLMAFSIFLILFFAISIIWINPFKKNEIDIIRMIFSKSVILHSIYIRISLINRFLEPVKIKWKRTTNENTSYKK